MQEVKFSKTGIPLNENDILGFEEVLGCSLPDDYRVFLLSVNGGEQPKPETFFIETGEGTTLKSLYSLKEGPSLLLEYQIGSFEGTLSDSLLPIGLDICGNHILMNLKGADRGQIYFHYHDRGRINPDDDFEPVYFVARSFNDFLSSLKPNPRKTEKDEIETLGESGNRSDLLEFLSNGNDIEKTNKYGRTLLQEAARYGNLKMLRACHEHDAKLNGAIHFAVMNRHLPVIDYLLSQGVNINELDKNGDKPLSYARKEFADELKKRGAIK